MTDIWEIGNNLNVVSIQKYESKLEQYREILHLAPKTFVLTLYCCWALVDVVVNQFKPKYYR